MARRNWKLVIGILVAAVIVVPVIVGLTRNVSPFVPSTDRQISNWGTVDDLTNKPALA